MGLIKKYQIEDMGTLVLEDKSHFISAPSIKAPAAMEFSSAIASKEEINKAKNEAQKIIDSARRQADQITHTAHDEGLEIGKAEAAEKIDQALDTLNQAVIERKKILKDAEAELLRLSIKIAEQIIKSEVSLHRDVCLNIVAEAIARVSDREQIIVKVNREDAEYLKRYKDRLASMLDGVKSFSIIEDSSIEPGGCVIETNLGFVDARISTKIKSIEESLQKVHANNQVTSAALDIEENGN